MRTCRFLMFLCMLLLASPTLYAQNYLQKAIEYLDAGDCDMAKLAYDNYKLEHPQGNAEVAQRIEECGKVKPPTVFTLEPTSITSTSVTFRSYVLDDGGDGRDVITARGVCWSTAHQPTLNDNVVDFGLGTEMRFRQISGLKEGTTYYVRAYATNAAGTAYGQEVKFTTKAPATVDGHPCPNAPTVTDYDGNVYRTVQIGSQCWMAENLRTKHFADGRKIAQGGSKSSVSPYWYYPDNDMSNEEKYGLLYNWTAVVHGCSSANGNPSRVQGICPDGWHVPSDAEWTQLTDYVSSQSQYVCGNDKKNIAKALAAKEGWRSDDPLCAVGNVLSDNNATGFAALPAGSYSRDSYRSFGVGAGFWSATEDESYSYDVWPRGLSSNYAGVSRVSNPKDIGESVRCVRSEGEGSIIIPDVTTSSVTNKTGSSVSVEGRVTSDGGAVVTGRGVCWSSSPNPTTNDHYTTEGVGPGKFVSQLAGLKAGTTYYARAYATNSVGTAYGKEVKFTTKAPATVDGQPCPNASTVADYDGNVYRTVQIGKQCWMAENLRTTHYANGTYIYQGSSISYNTPYWYYPDESSSNKDTYGLLYNWSAAIKACPTGWHLPTDEEWKLLEMRLGMSSEDADKWSMDDRNNWRGSIAAKLCGDVGWKSSETVNTPGFGSDSRWNSSGFGALPAGQYMGYCQNFGYFATFWSATWKATEDIEIAWTRSLDINTSGVHRNVSDTFFGYSVRCVKD